MITQEVADQYLKDKELFESGELELSPDEVNLRRTALDEFGTELERRQGRERGMWEKARAERVRRNFVDLETRGGNQTPEIDAQFAWAPNQDSIKAGLSLKELFAAHYDIPLEEAGQKFDLLKMDYASRNFGGKIPKTNVEFWNAEKARVEKSEAVEAETTKMIGAATANAFASALKGEAPNWGAALQKWREGAAESVLMKEHQPQEVGEAYRLAWQGARGVLDHNPALLEVFRMMTAKAGRADLTRNDEPAEGAGDEPERNPRQMQTRMAAGRIAAGGNPGEVETDAILDKLMTVPREEVRRFFDLLPAYLTAIGELDPQEAVAQLMTQFWGEVAQGYSSMMGDRKGVQDQMTRDAKVLRAIQEGRDVRVSARDGGFVSLDRLVTEADVAATNAIGGFGTGLQTYSHSTEEYGRVLTPKEANEVAGRLSQRIERGKFFFAVEEMTREMRPLRAVTPFKSAEMGLYGVANSAPMMARGIAASFIPLAGPLLAFASSADAMRSQEFQRLVTEFPDIDLERAEKAATISGLAQGVVELASTYGMRFGGSLLVRKTPNLAAWLERASGAASAFARPVLTRTGAGVAEEMGEEAVQGWISATVQNAILTDYPHVDAKKAFMDNISLEVGFASLFMRLPAVGAGTWTESRMVRSGLESREMMRSLGLSEEAAGRINALAAEGKYGQAEALMHQEYMALKPAQIEAGARYMEGRMRLAREAAADPAISEHETLQVRDGQWSIVRGDGRVIARFEDGASAQEALMARVAFRAERLAKENDGSVAAAIGWFQSWAKGLAVENRTGERKRASDLEMGPLDRGELAASMRRHGIEAGLDPDQVAILGENSAELVEGVYVDTLKLYGGSTAMTVFEEAGEAFLRRDLRDGLVSEEEAKAWTRAWSEKTGFELTDPANPTMAEVFEATSQMFEAHFLGKRKELPDVPKLFGLIKRLGVYLREAFGRARQLVEMREAGALSESAEGYLARALGIDEQVELNQKTAETVGAAASYSVGRYPGDEQTIPKDAKVWLKPPVKITKVTERRFARHATLGEAAKDALQVVRSIFEAHSKEGGISTPDLKEKIAASGKQMRHGLHLGVTHPHLRAHMEAAGVIDQLFENAVLVVSHDPSKGALEGDPLLHQIHRLAAPLQVGDQLYRVKLTVKEFKGDKHHYYDHSLTEIEPVETRKANPEADLSSRIPGSLPVTGATPLESINIADLLKDVKFGELSSYPMVNPSFSVARAADVERIAKEMERAGTAEKLAFAEKVRRNLERGRERVDLLEREQIYERQADARALQLEEDVANLQLRQEEGIEELRQQKAEQIEQAGTGSMAKFMDRIEAAKTERERTLLRREARETAADLKRGIEKDFKAQEKALRERFRGEEKVLREKALGAEKAERLKAGHEEARAATLQSLVDYNAAMMALPAELRGKLGGFVTLARLKTDRARDKFFREKFPKIEAAYEKYLRDEYDAALKKIFKQAKPKGKAGKRPAGKLGPELHALFAKLEEATGWDAAKLEGYIAELEQREADGTLTPEREDLADLEKAMLNLVVDWKHADSGRRGTAVRELKALLSKGLTEFRFKKGQERIERKERRERLVATTGSTGSKSERSQRAKKDAGMIGKRLAFLRAARLNLSSFEQVLFLAFGENPEAQPADSREAGGGAGFQRRPADLCAAQNADEPLDGVRGVHAGVSITGGASGCHERGGGERRGSDQPDARAVARLLCAGRESGCGVEVGAGRIHFQAGF
ncbi:MAG TPA: hypothetical protein VNQ90_17680 [Chthoniobacteraceae bacterium]|nr:hypothetical protein [Chthoniobacteraceae bacterium]